MKRMFEAQSHACVLAPQSVAAAAATTTDYVDAAGASEVAFLLTSAALGAGKSLTVELLAASSADGADARKVGEAKFTDAEGTAPALVTVSYRPAAENGRYVAVKFQHDAAAAVACGAIAATDTGYLPAVNGWTLVV